MHRNHTIFKDILATPISGRAAGKISYALGVRFADEVRTDRHGNDRDSPRKSSVKNPQRVMLAGH
jgi:hypothetical protein